jgi:hypothetical protein
VTVPVISVYNKAVTPLGFDLLALVNALEKYVGDFLVPVWNTPCTFNLTTGPVAGTWGFVFMDDADDPGALAYHTVEDGLPLSKVFVRTTLAAHELVSVSASHELVECLVDPSCGMTASEADGSIAALEAADPVEETTFPINGFEMSDFVTPAYFEDFHKPNSVPFDHCGVIQKPFQLAPGGYQSVQQKGVWTEVFGSRDKELRFSLEDRRGHRSEYRRQRSETQNAMVDAMLNV